MTVLPFLALLFLAWKTPADLVRDLSDDSIQIREQIGRAHV